MKTDEIKLVINKEITAPVEAVYRAWTEPDLIKQWFVPDSSMTVPNIEVDARVGGRYLFHVCDPAENSDHIVSGEYEEVIKNKKLVFSWQWKDGIDQTHVTVELTARGNSQTLLTLTHQGFSQQEFADKHNSGWNACLANIPALITEN